MKALIIFSCGLISGVSFAPYNMPFLYVVTFVIAFYLIGKAQNPSETPRSVALGVSLYFLGQFVSGLYWIVHALLFDVNSYIGLVPLSLVGIPLLLSSVYGLVIYLFLRLFQVTTKQFLCCLPLLLIVAEWLRGNYLLGGFPWNVSGYIFSEILSLMQTTALFGIYGLSFFIYLTLMYFVYVLHYPAKKVPIITTLTLLWVGFYGFGLWRLHVFREIPNTQTYIRLVQPNIAQQLKWDEAEKERHVETLIRLSAAPSAHPIKAVIWPETALPKPIYEPQFAGAARRMMAENQLLITGAIRSDGKHKWNSVIVLDHQLELVDYYDKIKLVPFGETIPGRALLPIMPVVGQFDFLHGEAFKVISTSQLPPFRPLVCYEVIFPGALSNQPAAKWILNLTNDAWYRTSPGPYQHFSMSRIRAIETGMPLVRVANTGISAMIDPLGRINAMLPLETQGVIDVFLPEALEKPTIFSKYQHLTLAMCLFIYFVLLNFFLKKRI